MEADTIMMESPAKVAGNVDMDLYSRQLGAYGLETMSKLVGLKVLMTGLQGAGAETAKNLILAGPGAVTIHDGSLVDVSDLGSNFLLRQEDVGKRTRAEASLEGLRALNPYVNVQLYRGSINEQIISQHNVLIVCNMTRQKHNEFNAICRRHNVGFISMGVFGLACYVFVDYGKEFTVTDPDGEEPKQVIIESIISNNSGATKTTTINCVDEKRLPFQNGEYVILSEIEGMDGLNHLGPIQVMKCAKHSFEIEVDSSKMGTYIKGGIARQVKRPRVMTFRSFSEACDRPIPPESEIPCLITPDLGKFGRSEQLHIAMQALWAYDASHECLPEPRDPTACTQVYRLAVEINEKYKSLIKEGRGDGVISVEEVDKSICEKLASYALCHISPMATFIGGVVAQEVIKYTGKYTPLHQWLYFDAFEILENLPSSYETNPEDFVPKHSRTDDQILLWGSKVQSILENLNVFLVGAGALGCEYLKNLAMLGVATAASGGSGGDGSGKGLITITDMDRIEVSNLNRQFLFRRQHVGKPKSLTAAEAIKEMNPLIHVKAMETRVGVETENVLTDEFWDSLDIVVNALDNIPSRLYVDGKCVWHLKPLLESGTLGTKGNVQVVVPMKTESYGDSRDPPEESIPLCTLRHFPNQIEHTIEWARDLFQGFFTDTVQETQKIVDDCDQSLKALNATVASASQRRTQLEKVVSLLEVCTPTPSFENCVTLAANQFHYLFNTDIAQLLYNFPLDHVTSNGVPFWSGPKRAPHVIELNPTDPLHLSFLLATANLIAEALGIEQIRDADKVAEMATKVKLAPFAPRKVVIKTDDNDDAAAAAAADGGSGSDDEQVCCQLEKRIRELAQIVKDNKKITLLPAEFEKDDDTNYHIDFITAAGNLRARNYSIPEAERWKAKIIAGKIIPAVATATAMVTGLATLELIKMVTRENRPMEHFKNSFANLALPEFMLVEPMPPKKTVDCDYDPIVGGAVRAKPNGFSSWDKVEVDCRGGQTLQSLVDQIEKKFETEVSILSAGNICLYNAYDRSQKSRLAEPMNDLLKRLTKEEVLAKNYAVVQACCTDSDGTDVSIPTIKCYFV